MSNLFKLDRNTFFVVSINPEFFMEIGPIRICRSDFIRHTSFVLSIAMFILSILL
jgi:hypothetical protein